mmetsp:Transcript_41589/g.134408  ORF Transcript_41589/g.134408 Transcript_41589/m.134408 type:complete len:283 (-) Transcript_41589:158-1006(-)
MAVAQVVANLLWEKLPVPTDADLAEEHGRKQRAHRGEPREVEAEGRDAEQVNPTRSVGGVPSVDVDGSRHHQDEQVHADESNEARPNTRWLRTHQCQGSSTLNLADAGEKPLYNERQLHARQLAAFGGKTCREQHGVIGVACAGEKLRQVRAENPCVARAKHADPKERVGPGEEEASAAKKKGNMHQQIRHVALLTKPSHLGVLQRANAQAEAPIVGPPHMAGQWALPHTDGLAHVLPDQELGENQPLVRVCWLVGWWRQKPNQGGKARKVHRPDQEVRPIH